MLVEIRSDRFRRGAIRFRSGLNVVLGDENGTNSIGKSSLLMVVDFALGGRSLTAHNTDVVAELGHHDYYFTFDFEGERSIFKRGTEHPDLVYACDEDYEVQRALRLDEFNTLLLNAYGVDLPDISFRALVGLFLRVWGKENLSVDLPLHTSRSQPARECVDTLIKAFGAYSVIRELAQRAEAVEAELKALRAAKRHEVVPALTKTDYLRKQREIGVLEQDLVDIKENLAAYATNISAIINRDVLKLKFQKDDLLVARANVESRLQRVQKNLANNRELRSRAFSDLTQFFPEINQDRLSKVEDFHNGLARILRSELKQSSDDLRAELDRVDTSIAEIDTAMAQALSKFEKPDALVDHVYGVALALHQARGATETYERETALEADLRVARERLGTEKAEILSNIEEVINEGMKEIVSEVFGENRKSPKLSLHERGYSFDVFEDTGTGTAYAGLVVFDLTVFLTSQLPVLSHDSLLFKNIENDSVAALVQVYLRTEKQSFIAIDEVSKYGSETSNLLRSRSVVQLDDKNVLYIKDWRRPAS